MSQIDESLINCQNAAGMDDRSADFELLAAGYCPSCREPTIQRSWTPTSSPQLEINCTACGRKAIYSQGQTSAIYAGLIDGANIPQAVVLDLWEIRQLERRGRELREIVIAQMASGAVVEPGVLAIALRTSERQNPTWEQIKGILGVAAEAALRRRIPPRTSQAVWLMPADRCSGTE